MRLIDYLLSTYGLISGDVSEVVEDLTHAVDFPGFTISSESTSFLDAITFLSDLQENPNKHVFFQHTPGWTIVLSNSSEIDSFSKFQKKISQKLKSSTISIVDIEDGKADFNNKEFTQTTLFRMLNENGEIEREISSKSKNGKVKVEDVGKGFGEFGKQKKLDSNTLSELIRKATKYDESLERGLTNQFFLVEESSK